MVHLQAAIAVLSTAQIIGIVVAALLVLTLIVVLVRALRRPHDMSSKSDGSSDSSLLDGPPHDNLHRLGHLAADARPDDEVGAATGDLNETRPQDCGPASEAEPADEAEPAADSEDVTAGSLPAVSPLSVTAAAPSQSPTPAVPASESARRMVPLNEIIVTTSHKMIDLDDLEVRHMLRDLVTYEIDQSTQFKELGQNLDAVLQLTEAEKICHALGMSTQARQIRDMMKGLQT
jgi:hypothetical protein